MNLTSKLAHKISTELNYDEEKSAVISYGIFAVFHTLAALALVAAFGLLLGVMVQALTVSFVSSILRQYSGGVHATRPSICLIVGTLATIIITIIAHYATPLIPAVCDIVVISIILVLSYYLVNRYAPVDSAAKPIRTEKKRKAMRKFSFIILVLYTMCILILLHFYYKTFNILFIEFSMCISLATGWQVFNLTKKGHRFLNKVDLRITKILFRKGDFS